MKMMRLTCTAMVIANLWSPSRTVSWTEHSRGHPFEQTDTSGAEIVDAYIETIGGIDAVKAVVRKRITYSVHMFGRDKYSMEKTWTRPDRMRIGRPGATSYTLTEGERSWRVDTDERREMSAVVARSMSKLADIDGPFIDRSEKGVTLTYSGLVRYDMTDLQQVTVTFSDGVEWEYFFDASTSLLRRVTQPSFRMLNDEISRGPDAHFFYYDYRPVGQVLYPHLWIQSAEDHTHLFVVDDIQVRQ